MDWDRVSGRGKERRTHIREPHSLTHIHCIYALALCRTDSSFFTDWLIDWEKERAEHGSRRRIDLILCLLSSFHLISSDFGNNFLKKEKKIYIANYFQMHFPSFSPFFAALYVVYDEFSLNIQILFCQYPNTRLLLFSDFYLLTSVCLSTCV